MNTKHTSFSMDLLHMAMNFILCYVVIACFLSFFTKDFVVLIKPTILFIAPLVTYISRKKCSHLWTFLLIHVGIVLIYGLLLNTWYEKVLYLLYLITLSIISIKTRIVPSIHEESGSIFLSLFPLGAGYFYCLYMKQTRLGQLIFLLAVCYMLLYFIKLYGTNFKRYFDETESMKNIPMAQIKGSNGFLIGCYTLFGFFVMLFFSFLPIGGILNSIKSFLKALLRFLVSLLPKGQDSGEILPQETPSLPPEMLGITEEQIPSPFFEFLEKLIVFIFKVGLILCLLALIIYVGYKIYKKFYGTKIKSMDKAEFLSPFDVKESIMPNFLRKKHFSKPSIFQDNNERIRYYFARYVTKQMKKNTSIPPQLTPFEIIDMVLDYPAIIETMPLELLHYYENARYGKLLCTKEDVKKVKALIKSS